MSGFMNVIGKDEIARRKTVSDKINDTDDLTFRNSDSNARSIAYMKNRDKRFSFDIEKLEQQESAEAYYDELWGEM